MPILQATIFRSHDGLPLSATTDVDGRAQVKDCQRYIKMLSKKLRQLPDRCTLHLQGFFIHFITALDQSFMVLSEESYPTVLAFSFLDEIQREFLLSYDKKKILSTKRPYSLIEFDNFLQKTKQRYNNPRSLTTKINLSDLSQEIKLRPPYQITEFDMETVSVNGPGVIQHNIPRPTVGPGRRLIPVDWLGMVVLALTLFCAALNFLRGVSILSHGHIDDTDEGVAFYGLMFLAASSLQCSQIYHIFYYTAWRRPIAMVTLVLLCMCNLYVGPFRNWVQIVFHMLVALATTLTIWNRTLQEKLPGYNV